MSLPSCRGAASFHQLPQCLLVVKRVRCRNCAHRLVVLLHTSCFLCAADDGWGDLVRVHSTQAIPCETEDVRESLSAKFAMCMPVSARHPRRCAGDYAWLGPLEVPPRGAEDG